MTGRFQLQGWTETAKSLLGARTKQKIGLNTSQNSVKGSSLDSDGNIENRQMITVLPFYGIIQNSAYSLAGTTKNRTYSSAFCLNFIFLMEP